MLDEIDSLTVGWGVSVELIELVISLTLLPLSIVAGLVTLTIGVTGNIPSTVLQSSSVVLQPEAQNEKVKTLA